MGLGKKIILLGLASLFFSSCHEEIGPQAVNGSTVVPDSNAVVIVNEGNFQWGNASIGLYNPDLDSYQDGLYRAANGKALGDVLQEAHKIGNRYYLVLNGSNELVICQENWEELYRIPGQQAPYRLQYWQGGIWMSDLYQPRIQELNLDGQLVQELNLSGAAKSLAIWQGNLLIAHQRKLEMLNSIGTGLESLWQTTVDIKAVLIHQDQLFIALGNGTLWSWSHPDSNMVLIDSLNLVDAGLSEGLSTQGFYSYDGDSVYLHSQNQGYTGHALCKLSCENFYGMDYHSESKSLFIFDALNYVQPHRVWQLDAQNGRILHEFSAGALPNGIIKNWDN